MIRTTIWALYLPFAVAVTACAYLGGIVVATVGFTVDWWSMRPWRVR